MNENNITLEITELNSIVSNALSGSLLPKENKHEPIIDTRYKPPNTELIKKEISEVKHITNMKKLQKDKRREQLLLRFKLIQKQKRLQRRKKLLVF